MVVPQYGAAVLETDHPMTERDKARVLAELQAIGLRAVLLPCGVSLVHAATQELDCDEGDGDEW